MNRERLIKSIPFVLRALGEKVTIRNIKAVLERITDEKFEAEEIGDVFVRILDPLRSAPTPTNNVVYEDPSEPLAPSDPFGDTY